MKKQKPVIGVLALQGAVDLHKPHIEAADGTFKAVKTKADIESVDAYILPGGESTTMLKLIDRFELWDVLKKNFEAKPVWGICAGSILMAKTVYVDESKKQTQKSFGLVPVEIIRNGYGRQLDSHTGKVSGFDVSFIRAPVISGVPDTVEVVAEQDNVPVWVKLGKHMMTTFHAELTKEYPSPMHRLFVGSIG